MEIHPMYDPVDQLWFVGRKTARTLPQLLTKFPQGTIIKDYYPNGYGTKVVYRAPKQPLATSQNNRSASSSQTPNYSPQRKSTLVTSPITGSTISRNSRIQPG